MLKAIFLLLLTFSAFARDEYATMSVQRFQEKLVVTINHDEGWHTYWKNPGDAGIASTFKFSTETKSYEWPAPKKYIEAGDILTIGYSGVQHFFFDNIPETFDLKIGVLICKYICIPGEASLKLDSNENFVSSRKASPFIENELKKAFSELPQDAPLPSGFEYYLTREKNKPNLTLHYSLKNVKDPSLPAQLNFLTAFPHSPFGFKRESLYIKDDVLYGKTEIEWDGEYLEPPLLLPESGRFEKPYQLKFLLNSPNHEKVSVVHLEIQDFSNASASLNEFYSSLPPLDGKNVTTSSEPEKNIFHYFLFAFLGGLILNLMPCVLPVISLKLFGLIKHKNLPRKQIGRAHV